MHFDELREIGNEAAVKAAGKLHMSGKTYVVSAGGACVKAHVRCCPCACCLARSWGEVI